LALSNDRPVRGGDIIAALEISDPTGNRPRFSHNGKWIACEIVARGGGLIPIWIVAADGGTLCELMRIRSVFGGGMRPVHR
jgi:hypothetical protein